MFITTLRHARRRSAGAYDRYGMASLVQARLVALDLLDILLAADCATGRSLLFEFATLLDIPVALDGISISGRHGRTVRIRRVKKLGVRCFATTIADHLMCGSMPDTGHAGSTRLRFDPRFLRTHWLWPLIPQPSLDLLVQRAKNWPRGYVRSCWPELENIDRTPVLHRRRKLIAAHRGHENLGKAIVN